MQIEYQEVFGRSFLKYFAIWWDLGEEISLLRFGLVRQQLFLHSKYVE